MATNCWAGNPWLLVNLLAQAVLQKSRGEYRRDEWQRLLDAHQALNHPVRDAVHQLVDARLEACYDDED